MSTTERAADIHTTHTLSCAETLLRVRRRDYYGLAASRTTAAGGHEIVRGVPPELCSARHEVRVAVDVLFALPLLVCPETFEQLLCVCKIVSCKINKLTRVASNKRVAQLNHVADKRVTAALVNVLVQLRTSTCTSTRKQAPLLCLSVVIANFSILSALEFPKKLEIPNN